MKTRIALAAFAPVVWGSTYVVTTELLPAGHPLFAGLLRALPAGLIALAITRTLPTGAWWARAAALGVLNIGLFFPFLFIAAERLPGGVAATLGAAQPLVVAVLAVGLLKESPSAWRFAWGVVGVVGVGLVVPPLQTVPFKVNWVGFGLLPLHASLNPMLVLAPVPSEPL